MSVAFDDRFWQFWHLSTIIKTRKIISKQFWVTDNQLQCK